MTSENTSSVEQPEVPAPIEHSKVPAFLKVPWSIRDVVIFVVAWFGLQAVIVVVLEILGPHVPVIAQFVSGAQNNAVGPSFALDLLDALVGMGLVSWYLHHYQVGWKTVGWRRVKVLRAIGYLVAVMVGFIILASALLAAVSWLVPAFNANQPQNNEFIGDASKNYNLALVALVLLPPVLEETIFRGFLFPAIAKRTGVIWGAIISSAIFGLAHLQANVSIYTFILGLLLCFMYVRLKSIVPGIFLHMLNNYLAFIALSGSK